jgi:GLPGLI family protein
MNIKKTKHSLILILLYLSNFTLAQTNKVLYVEYDEIVSYIPNVINNDIGILYVTNKELYYKTIFDNVSKIDKIDKSDNLTIVVPAIESEYFSEIYIDFKSKELSENIYERRILKKFFSVKESKVNFNWKILEDEKKIGIYNCKKAITTFRGRTYTVWFTNEIPIPYGPWKLNGLPGLILSAEDSEGIYKWNAKLIKYPFEKKIDFNDLKKRMLKYKEISFKDLDNNIINGLKNKFETSKARNNNRIQGINYGFSTREWKEPVNEWRDIKDYKF